MYKYSIYAALFFCPLAHADGEPKPYRPFYYSTYVGFQGGAGSTTWQGLVPAYNNQNGALIVSTPTHVNEGGGVWGFYGGYELSPYFALEASYLNYPEATVFFDKDSLFAFDNNAKTALTTKAETVSIVGKFMLVIPHTYIRAFSNAGVAVVQRKDEVYNAWTCSPTFGVGLNFNFTERVMGEVAFSYTAGYGESEISPVNSYIPFLYAVILKLGYRFA